jgi:hypothetical protein
MWVLIDRKYRTSRAIPIFTDRQKLNRFHPIKMKEVVLAMAAYFEMRGIEYTAPAEEALDEFDWNATSDKNVPVLVQARNDNVRGRKDKDVTSIIRFLLRRQGNTRLVLKRPWDWFHSRRCWWYYIFGHQNALLTLHCQQDIGDGSYSSKVMLFSTGMEIDIELRAGPPSDALLRN